MTKSYELCALFAGTATPMEIDEMAKQVEALITASGAEIKFSHNLGRKKLAYKIAGNTHGEYRSWLFTADTAHIPSLNAKLRLANFVARHLITQIEEKTIAKRVQKAAEARLPKRAIAEEPVVEAEVKEVEIKSPAFEPTEAPRVVEPEIPARPVKEKTKASLEDLDKKLDEILENDTI